MGILTSWNVTAMNPANVRFGNEQSDTTRINDILTATMNKRLAKPGDVIADIAQGFIGTPYVAHTLESNDGVEYLTVSLDKLDCTTFVETVTAMAMTIGEHRSSWRDFVYNLERLRYRGGQLDGYGSRLHYICDWVVNNVHKGIIKDATPDFPKVNYAVKTIDFMSANRDKYPALADSATFERIKSIEIGYSNHRYPFIKTIDLSDKMTRASFKSGDIVALTSTIKNLDVTHMGIIIVSDGEPHLLHASSSLGKVVLSDVTLAEFMKRNRSLTGVRVIRLLD